MPSNHLILCCFLLLLSSIFGSIRVFSSDSDFHITWPKYWNFSFSISPSNEYSGLISFRIEWFDLLAVQGSHKSLLQHHSLKTSILWHSFQFSSVTQLCPTLCNPMNRSTPGLLVHQQLPELTQTHVIELVMPSSHLILCRPLLLLPQIPPSIRVLPNESGLRIRWPKYWSFSFSISLSNEHPGLISCRMDWLDVLAVHGTLKSLLQNHSSKASIIWRSAFFKVQLSHPHMTTGKTIALTRWTFVGKAMSLLLNMLSRLVITFLPRSKHLLISWLQSPSAVILEPRNVKSATVSTVSPFYLP